MTLYGLVGRLAGPPACFLLMMAVGLLLSRRKGLGTKGTAGGRRQLAGKLLLVGGFVLLWVSALPWVGAVLIRSLEQVPAWELDQPLLPGEQAEAIVLLGAGVEGETPEYGGLTLGALSLERVRWAARVQRATGLPLVITGGSARPGATPVAELMRDALVQDFDVNVRWVEGASATTWENAALSKQLLSSEGIDHIVLVTHSWHMPRAVLAFERHGFSVQPAPTMFHGEPPDGLDAWLPSARALRHTSWATHEWLGRLWYSIRSDSTH